MICATLTKDIHTCKRMLIVLTRMKRKGKIETVPEKVQLTNYLAHRRRKLGDRNNIDDIKSYIMNHLLIDEMNDADLFFFGIEISNGMPIIGNGTDKSHFHSCFSSKILLRKLNNTGQFHIDCTYKIIKYFYPLLVFGITDFERHFQPIAFMVTSHETEEDFKYFFRSLDTIAQELKIKYNINTIIFKRTKVH